MLYKIDPKYSLVLKKNNELLIIREKSIKRINVDEKDISKMENILHKSFFPYENTKVFKTLLKKKVIIKVTDHSDNYNTNSYLETYIKKEINTKDFQSKSVAIIGLGGIGVEILNHLIGAGIDNFVLVDYDKVEATNLNRQYIYDRHDLNKNKIDIVKQKAKLKNANCNIFAYNKFIESSEDIGIIVRKHDVDMVVCAADTPYLDIRIAIVEACLKHSKPCIFGGVGIETGQYGPTLLTKRSKQSYLQQLNRAKDKIVGSNINKASFGPTNSVIAAYMAMDISMLLLNSKKDVASLNSIHEINFKKRNDYEIKKI